MNPYQIQKTISKPVLLEGKGIHTAQFARLILKPAPVNYGIQFVSSQGPLLSIKADVENVTQTLLATSLGKEGIEIKTIEHLMAAAYAMGVTNLIVEVDGPEIPIFDGSSIKFVKAMKRAGLEWQPYTAPYIKIKKPVQVFENQGVCELLPRENLRITASIDFAHPLIQVQTFALDLTPEAFEKEIAFARTFGFERDVQKLQALELALGADLSNVVAFSETGLLNPEGLRTPDECIRHKILDAIGDLALCGAYIQGEFVSYRGGHRLHKTLLMALSDHRESWEWVPAEPLTNVFSLETASPLTSPYSAS